MSESSGSRRKQGILEIAIGFVLFLVFLVTLTIEIIPIIWTGAALMGLISVLYGLYHLIRG